MGRHRFRLADMLPHSWFHKLKVKTTPTTPTPTNPTPSPPPPAATLQHPINYGRPSYYIPSNSDHSPLHPKASDTKFLVDPKRKSKKKPKKIHGSRPPLKPLSPSLKNLEWDPSATTPDLPPILTKPMKEEHAQKEQEPRTPRKRSGTHGGAHHGIKMRSNSPRLVGRTRRVGNGTRKGLRGSVPIVKSSADPQKDFRESMVEMIVENNIRAGEEMEELLACYLTLNSKEYHDVIVKVFEQIWVDLTTLRLS